MPPPSSSPADTRPLVDGGPSDQASVRPDPQDAGEQGSQSGRPQAEDADARRRADREGRRPPEATPPRAAPGHEDDGSRGVSATERSAGTPDPHARTDTGLGDGTR